MKNTNNNIIIKRGAEDNGCGLKENVLQEMFTPFKNEWAGLEPLAELPLDGTFFGPIVDGIRETYNIKIRIKRLEETAPPDQKWQITLASVEGSVLATGYALFAEARLAQLTAAVAVTQGWSAAFAAWYAGQVAIAQSAGELANDWTALSYQWISTGTLGGETFQTIRNDVKGIKHYLPDQDCNGVKVLSYTGHPGNQKALSTGDPHLITFDTDGKPVAYDFQAPGDYVAIKSTTDDYEVQVRHESWASNPNVAMTTAVAVNTDGATLAISLPPKGTPCSTEGNDNIVAPNTASSRIFGGEDQGEARISTPGSVTFLDASYGLPGHVFGYYVHNTTAPLYGQVIVANANDPLSVGKSTTFDDSIPLNQIGYFMIPSGYNTQNVNNGLADGVNVTFQ